MAERRDPLDWRSQSATSPDPYAPDDLGQAGCLGPAAPSPTVRIAARRCATPVQLIGIVAAVLLIVAGLYLAVLGPRSLLTLLIPLPANPLMPPDWPEFSGSVQMLAAIASLLLGLLIAIGVWTLFPAWRPALVGAIGAGFVGLGLFIAAVFSHPLI